MKRGHNHKRWGKQLSGGSTVCRTTFVLFKRIGSIRYQWMLDWITVCTTSPSSSSWWWWWWWSNIISCTCWHNYNFSNYLLIIVLTKFHHLVLFHLREGDGHLFDLIYRYTAAARDRGAQIPPIDRDSTHILSLNVPNVTAPTHGQLGQTQGFPNL